jgi:hypothetical protein
MAGYDGYSKSLNALHAETEGKFPLSIAVKEVALISKCTQKIAREALIAIGPTEWHHTSKFYNATNYYSIEAAVKYLRLTPVLEWIAEHKDIDKNYPKDGTTEEQRSFFASLFESISKQTGFTADDICDAYYSDYEI